MKLNGSPDVTKDGAELDALVGEDDKVYLGRRDHYDNRGHYINDDKSAYSYSGSFSWDRPSSRSSITFASAAPVSWLTN